MQLVSPYWLDALTDGYATARPMKRLAVGLLAIGAVIVSLMSAPGAIGFLGAGLAILMLVIAVIDGRSFLIPDPLTGAGFGLALVHAAVLEPDAMLTAVAVAVLRGALLAAIFFLIRYGYQRLRGREGLGLGDVKLSGVAGAWLDWSFMPIVVEITAGAALVVYLFRHFVLGRPVLATSRLPFGLFFAPSIWVCWVLEMMLLGSF
jgi:leader peptidase (prepilin peptidase) / N-methyltransferase